MFLLVNTYFVSFLTKMSYKIKIFHSNLLSPSSKPTGNRSVELAHLLLISKGFNFVESSIGDKKMKKIECLIQNKKLNELEVALRAAGVRGMTVSEVKGFGNEQTRPDSYLFLPKTKVEIYCTNEELDHILDTIIDVCQTGNLGDGKIAVFDAVDIIRIRTKERGMTAI